ncbi:thiamine diphosphokinase [Roseobacter sp. YSTF-M11]|uniref:Thiamine diphosphokinase n=1 Tax=Roseobacter insulae TaxID=2859783 RepID=A0A9X1K503_9RHOB|nr:thiamine diphosphokinase [Roseobacter insulae]MBW4710247.1 thiamine diphosphokinase [Roseobacter insulae]
MNNKIIHKFEPVTLIGGGAIGPDDLRVALDIAPTCVAADSGADAALQARVELTAVFGDMDSISEAARAQIPEERVHLIPDQISTDFDKALRNIDAPLVVAVGFMGRRVDHQLAALHTLVMRPDRPCVILSDEDVIFLCPQDFDLPTPVGTRVSLFPMGDVQGRSEGLQWPIDGLAFSPSGTSGTSNRTTGDLKLVVEAPLLLCFLPRRFIRPVAQRLAAQPRHARWPARAERCKDLQPS